MCVEKMFLKLKVEFKAIIVKILFSVFMFIRMQIFIYIRMNGTKFSLHDHISFLGGQIVVAFVKQI